MKKENHNKKKKYIYDLHYEILYLQVGKTSVILDGKSSTVAVTCFDMTDLVGNRRRLIHIHTCCRTTHFI